MTAPADNDRAHPFDALATIGCIYLGLVTLGFAAFRYLAVLPVGASRNQDRTFFTSANAVSLTGFAQGNAAVENYPTLGLIMLAFLALASALTSLIGGGYLLARAVGHPIRLQTIVLRSLAILIAPALALLPWVGPFDSISAATGLGLTTHRAGGLFLAAVVVAASLPGLMGVLPLVELISPHRGTDERRRYVSLLLPAVALLVIAGTLVMFACGSPRLSSATHSLALRSLGGAGLPLDATAAMPWAASFLAILGAAPASTASGLSLLPIIVLVVAAVNTLRGHGVDRLAGIAIAWLLGYLVLAAVTVAALAALSPALPADRVIVLAFGALGNVGISHEPLGITGTSLFLLSAAMLLGRLLPLVMLAWMATVAEQDRQVAAPSSSGEGRG